jgi:hypothetical protein
LFHSNQRKIVFLTSFLSNSAFDWYQALSDELCSGTFAAFKEAFFQTYSNGDLHTKAVEKLYALAQRKASVSKYLTQFDTWQVALNTTTSHWVMLSIVACLKASRT